MVWLGSFEVFLITLGPNTIPKKNQRNNRGNRATLAPGHCYAHSRCVLALPALPMGVASGQNPASFRDDGYPTTIQNVQLVHKVLLTS